MRTLRLALGILGSLGSLGVLGIVGGCVDSDFLEGAKCSSHRECGRSLPCEHQVCGGCPEDIPLVQDRCACPGERVLDCRAFESPPYCVPVCGPRQDLCKVAEIDGPNLVEILSCDEDSSGRCFELLTDDPECSGSDTVKIRVIPDGSIEGDVVINCPPPESAQSRFDCEPP